MGGEEEDEEEGKGSRSQHCLRSYLFLLYFRPAGIIRTGFALKEAGSAFLVVDVRQTMAFFSPDRTKILDRISGNDGKGHRELNALVRWNCQALLSPEEDPLHCLAMVIYGPTQ